MRSWSARPARIRDFLLDTSILSRLTGPLCAAVTGQDDAKAILDELDRSNMFLVPLDDRRTWYRYHHLFGDVVRARLLDEQPDRVAELHRRASDWYADNGDPQEAITHALAGDDPERAAELIELAAPAMQRARQESQLRSWLEALPADLYNDRPVLAMALIGARMATGDTTALDPLLEIVDSWLGPRRTHRSCSTTWHTAGCPPWLPCIEPDSRSSPATPTGPSSTRTASSSWPGPTTTSNVVQPWR